VFRIFLQLDLTTSHQESGGGQKSKKEKDPFWDGLSGRATLNARISLA
jgi:hypothetical protein